MNTISLNRYEYKNLRMNKKHLNYPKSIYTIKSNKKIDYINAMQKLETDKEKVTHLFQESLISHSFNTLPKKTIANAKKNELNYNQILSYEAKIKKIIEKCKKSDFLLNDPDQIGEKKVEWHSPACNGMSIQFIKRYCKQNNMGLLSNDAVIKASEPFKNGVTPTAASIQLMYSHLINTNKAFSKDARRAKVQEFRDLQNVINLDSNNVNLINARSEHVLKHFVTSIEMPLYEAVSGLSCIHVPTTNIPDINPTLFSNTDLCATYIENNNEEILVEMIQKLEPGAYNLGCVYETIKRAHAIALIKTEEGEIYLFDPSIGVIKGCLEEYSPVAQKWLKWFGIQNKNFFIRVIKMASKSSIS